MAGSESSTIERTSTAAPTDGGAELVMTRLFDAPRALVYAAWTEEHHLARWQGGPVGFTVTAHKADIRPGGEFRLCMRSPEGKDHWLEGVYREVVKPERLVFTHRWLDERGGPGPETLVTMTFAERGERTELTLHQMGFVSPASRTGHGKGWTSTFEGLAAYLHDITAAGAVVEPPEDR